MIHSAIARGHARRAGQRGVTGFIALSIAVSAVAPLEAQQFPTSPPPPAPPRPATLPPFQEAVLANGVRVVLVENHQNPVIAFRLAIPAGGLYDAKEKTGTASLVATLLLSLIHI